MNEQDQMSLDEAWAKRSHEMFTDRVDEISGRLREMADRIQREARLWLESEAAGSYGMGGRHAQAAGAVQKTLLSELNNLSIERLTYDASEADLAEMKMKA